MTNEQQILHDLVFWHKVFAICFIAFMILTSISGAIFIKEVSAYHQCAAVADSKFTSCYYAAQK